MNVRLSGPSSAGRGKDWCPRARAPCAMTNTAVAGVETARHQQAAVQGLHIAIVADFCYNLTHKESSSSPKQVDVSRLHSVFHCLVDPLSHAARTTSYLLYTVHSTKLLTPTFQSFSICPRYCLPIRLSLLVGPILSILPARTAPFISALLMDMPNSRLLLNVICAHKLP